MHILVVDDSEVGRAAIRELLSSDGHVVAEARDAATALDLAGSLSLDLVLVDVVLGVDSGVRVARTLADAHGTTPILLMSVDPAPDSDVAAAGARGFVLKERLAAVDLAELVA